MTDPTTPISGGVNIDLNNFKLPETIQFNGSELGKNYVPASLNDPGGLENYLNENQGKLHTFANIVAQSAGSAVLGTIEAASYLGDWEQIGDKLHGDEQEYDNWLAQSMRKAKEDLKEAAPIYRSEEGQQAFSPGSRSFWTSNSPDVIGTVVGLMIPSMVAGKIAKGLVTGINRVGQGIGATSKGIGAVTAHTSELFGSVAASRYAESTMEANQIYQSTYAELKQKNPYMPEEQVRDLAGQAASRTWNTNWLLAVQDIFQYNTLLKGLKAGSKAKQGFGLSDLITQPLSEGAEEGVQFILGEEAKRSGLTGGKNYFTNGFWEDRFSDYVSSDEFKASVALGAMGGGVFGGVGKIGELKNRQANLNMEALAKERANYTNNIGVSKKIDEDAFKAISFQHLKLNKLDKLAEDLDQLSKAPGVEPEIKDRLRTQIEDLKYLQDTQASVKTSAIPKDLHDTAVANYYDKRVTARLGKGMNDSMSSIYKDLLQNEELPQELEQLKRLQISARAFEQLVKEQPEKYGKQRLEIAAEYAKQLEMFPDKQKTIAALQTAKDQELVNLNKQIILNNAKVEAISNDILAYTTPEGIAEAQVKQKEKEAIQAAEKKVADPKATVQELKDLASKASGPEVKQKLNEKVEAIETKEKEDNLGELAVQLDNSGPDTEATPDEVLAPDPYDPNFREQYENGPDNNDPPGPTPGSTGEIMPEVPDPSQQGPPEIDPAAPFDPASTIIDPSTLGTYNDISAFAGKPAADELLKRYHAEHPPEPIPQKPKVTQDDTKAQQELRERGTIPAWTKVYQGHWENKNGKETFVYDLDQNGNKQEQLYFDATNPSEEPNTPVSKFLATTPDGILVVDSPLMQRGDPVLLEVADNGLDKQWPFTYTKNFRPIPGNYDQIVINVWRVDDEGHKLDKLPAQQLPSGDNKYSKSPQLTKLRKEVIDSPNQRIYSTVAGKNIGDPRTKKGLKNSVEILENDFYYSNEGWVYGKTPHKPIFVVRNRKLELIVPNLGGMAGVDTLTRDRALNVESTGVAVGAVSTLRVNGEGNFKIVPVQPRNLNEQEVAWVQDNLGKAIAENDLEFIDQVYYIPQHSYGVYNYPGRTTESPVPSFDRRRFHIVKTDTKKYELLIPVTGKDNANYWVVVPGNEVTSMIKGEPFNFTHVDQSGFKSKEIRNSLKYTLSTENILKSFKEVLNNNETSKRNIKESTLNQETIYTDPIAGEYPTYYDFVVANNVMETDLEGSKNPGYGKETSYSFENSRLRISPTHVPTKVIVDKENETIVKGIKDPLADQVPAQKTEVPATPKSAEELWAEDGEKLREVAAEGFKTISTTELDWFKDKFGEEFLQVAKGVDRILSKQGLEAFGIYHNALVKIADLSEQGTLFHEAFHFVFDPQLGLTTNLEREKILNEASKIYGIARSFDNGKGEKLRPVDYTLKAVDILQSQKAIEWFKKADKNQWRGDLFWTKLQQELQIPKEQIELFKSLAIDNYYNREQLLLDFTSAYSYTIDIKVTKDSIYDNIDEDGIRLDDSPPIKVRQDFPSQHYSNLTVPGGTNYRENEIATPAITPSIKGHAAFSSPNGIGWFRSDDRLLESSKQDSLDEQEFNYHSEEGNIGPRGSENLKRLKEKLSKAATKTRRILEVQSDLFQKGRSKETITEVELEKDGPYAGYPTMDRTKNNFLQLLNKDSNWVSFFVKSIVQDSIKKGYEKVLFPKGDTASKVEGHTTLEEFKKQKEDRLKQLEGKEDTKDQRVTRWFIGEEGKGGKVFDSKEEAEAAFANSTNPYIKDNKHLLTIYSDTFVQPGVKYSQERNQLKAELERVEKEGFAALRSIYKFYEETVGNILKKQYGDNIKEVKDEYGNGWYELNLKEEHKDKIKLRALKPQKELTGDEQLEEKLAEDFRAYMLSNGKIVPKVAKSKNFFQRLWTAIKNLIGLKSPIEKLFKRISSQSLNEEQKEFARLVREYGAGNEMTRLLPGFQHYKMQGQAIQATSHELMKLAAIQADKHGVELLAILKEKENINIFLEEIRRKFSEEANMLKNGILNRSNDERKRYTVYKAMGVVQDVNPFNGKQGEWDDIQGKGDTTLARTGFATEVIKDLKRFGFIIQIKDITNYTIAEDKEASSPGFNQEQAKEVRQIDEANRLYGQDAIAISPNANLSQRMRLFIASIPDPNVGVTVLGTSTYMNFNRVMASLKNKLANTRKPLTKLEKLAKNDPIAKAVFDALSAEQQEGNEQLIAEFSTRFNLAHHNLKTILKRYNPERKGVEARYIDTDRQSAGKVIKNSWRQEAERKKILDTNGTVNAEKANALQKEITIYKAKYINDKHGYKELLSNFLRIVSQVGITLPEQVIENIDIEAQASIDKFWSRRSPEEQGKKLNEKKVRTVEKLFFDKDSASLEHFIDMLVDLKNAYEIGGTVADKLAAMSKDYVEYEKGDSFTDEFDNMIHPINLPSYITELIRDAQDPDHADRIVNFFKQDKFYENNEILKLIASPKERAKITLDFISAFTEDGDAKDFENRTAADSLYSRYVAYLNQDADNAGIYVGTFSDKSKQGVLGLPRKKKQSAEDFLTTVLNSTVLAEITRIQRIRKFKKTVDLPYFSYINKGTGEKVFPGEQFLYVPELNTIEGLSASLSEGEISPDAAVAAQRKAKDLLKAHIETQYTQFKTYLAQKGLVLLDPGNTVMESQLPEASESKIKEWFMNDYAWRLETSKLISGDIALYKDVKDYYKRGYQGVTPGTVVAVEGSFTRAIYSKQTIQSWVYPGKDINKTDAQSYVDTDTTRKILKATGVWASQPGLETLYEFAWKDGKTVARAIKDKGVSRELGDKLRKLLNEVSIEIFKPIQFNDRDITLPDGSTLITKEQFKDSWMWLNPELTNRHTEFKKMSEFMKTNKINVFSAADTAKVGSYGVIQSFDKPPDASQIRTVDFDKVRFPQVMPSKKKKEIPGSQFWKLIVGNNVSKKVVEKYNELWEEKLKGASDTFRKSLDLGTDWQLSSESEKRSSQLYRLQSLLKNELGARTLNDVYSDALELEYDKDGQLNFKMALGFPSIASKFVSILTNLFSKNILDITSPGFSMVNFADWGVEKAETSSNLTMVKNPAGSVEAEVGLPISYFRKLGLNFKDHVDPVTHKVKWEELSKGQKEALQFIIYRIPTSNKSSMIPARAVMILPESSGNVIMLPGELTVQQGLDFDVDKSQVLMRVLDKEANIDKESVDNKLFDLAWEILTDPKNIKELLTPLDFETIKDIAKEYEKEGIVTSKSQSAFLTMGEDIDYEIRNKHGAAMIGIDSRANTAHAVMQTIQSYISISPTAGFNIARTDKHRFNKVAGLEDNKGILISQNYGELQQSSLDNAKDPVKSILNIFPTTDPTVLYINELGAELRLNIAFINQPIIREWYQLFEQEGSAYKATVALKEKYPTIVTQLGDKKLGSVYISEDDLMKGLKEQVETDPRKQARIFLEFEKQFALGQHMSKINNVLSVDTFGGMTSIEDIEIFMNQLDAVTDEEAPIVLDRRLFHLETAPKESRRLAAFWDYGIRDALKFTEQFIPYTTQAYRDNKAEFATVQGLRSLNNKKTIKSINTFLEYYSLNYSGKLQEMLDRISHDYVSRWSFIQPERSIWKHIEKMKVEKKEDGTLLYPTLKNNNLIKGIQNYTSKKDTVQMIGVVNTSSNIDKNDMMQGWSDLYFDPKTKQLAGDLVRFAITSSGFVYSTRSFADIIPVDLWTDQGLSHDYKQILSNLKLGQSTLDPEGAMRNFIRHKFAELEEVPEAYYSIGAKGPKTNLLSVKADGSHVQAFTLAQNDPIALSQRRIALPRFIKIKDSGINRFRLYEASKQDEYYYKEVQPLGEYRNFWEVTGNLDGRSHSQLPTNGGKNIQLFGSPEPFKDAPVISSKGLIEQEAETVTTIQPIIFKEHPETGYRGRTILNASADVTIAIATDFNSAGEKLTKSSVLQQGKLYLPVSPETLNSEEKFEEAAKELAVQMIRLGKKELSLNIAGNGIYTLKGRYTQEEVDELTHKLLSKTFGYLADTKVVTLRSGGQTGFDEAGVKAGRRLGIKTGILAPKGWKFRNKEGVDISDEQQFKARFDITSTERHILKPLFTGIQPGETTYIGKYIPNGKVTVAQALLTILENEGNLTNKENATRLLGLVGKVNTPIFTEKGISEDNHQIPGVFRVIKSSNGTVRTEIAINSMFEQSEEELRRTILHEINHAYTEGILTAPSTPEEVSFVRNVNRLVEEARKAFKGPQPYGLTDAHEFIAELGSSPKFRAELRANESLWNKWIRFLRKVIGIKSDRFDDILKENYSLLDKRQDLLAGVKHTQRNKEAETKEKKEGRKELSALEQMHATVKAKINRLNTQGKKVEATRTEEWYEELKKLETNKQVVAYVIKVFNEMEDVKKSYQILAKDPANINPDILQPIQAQLESYALVRSFNNQISRTPDEFIPANGDVKQFQETLGKLVTEIDRMSESIHSLALDYFATRIKDDTSNPNLTKEKIKENLKFADRDITWFSRLQDVGSEIRDEAVLWLNRAVSKIKGEAWRSTQDALYRKDSKKEETTVEVLVENKSNEGMHYERRHLSFTTTGFYKALADYEKWLGSSKSSSAFRDKFAPIIDQKSLEENDNGVQFISPWSKEGKRIRAISENSPEYPLRQMYETYVLGYLKSQVDNIPARAMRPGLRIPSIQETMMETLLKKGVKNKVASLTDQALNEVRNRYDEKDYYGRDENGNKVDYVPVRYVSKQDGTDGRLTTKQVSMDIATTIPVFFNEMYSRKGMEELASTVELGETLLEKRKVMVTKQGDSQGISSLLTAEREGNVLESGEFESTPGSESESLKAFRSAKRRHLYGQLKKEEGSFKKGDYRYTVSKMVDAFLKYSGFNLMFGNVAIPLTNKLVGEIQWIKEAVGGDIVNFKDMAYGKSLYWDNAFSALGDFAQREKKTKLGRVFTYFNPYDHEQISGLGTNTNYAKEIFDKIISTGGRTIEYQLGVQAMGAAMNRFKATKDGKEVPLYDALDIASTGKVQLAPGYTYKGKKELSGEDIQEIKDYTLRAYQNVYGVNNVLDKGGSNEFIAGRLFNFMRGWLQPGINTRWRTKFYDERLKKDTEGHYLSTILAFNNIFSGESRTKIVDTLRILTFYAENKPELLLHPNEMGLPEEQQQQLMDLRKANIRKTMFEMYILAFLSILLVAGWDDDEESYLKYIVVRMRRELAVYSNPISMWDVIRTPSVAMSSIDGMFSLAYAAQNSLGAAIMGEEQPVYERGKYQGENKLLVAAQKRAGLGSLNQFEDISSTIRVLQTGAR